MVKEFTLESLTSLWERYFQEYGHKPRLLEVANAFPDERSFAVDYREIADRAAARLLEAMPGRMRFELIQIGCAFSIPKYVKR